MKKKQQKAPLVSSVAARIKQTVPDNGVEVATEEETKARKKNFLSMLDKATEQLATNLEQGKVELTTSLDFERVVKLTLLLSGEADSIRGTTGTKESEVTTDSRLSMSKIDEILNDEDPAVQELFKRLYYGYNAANDQANEEKGGK